MNTLISNLTASVFVSCVTAAKAKEGKWFDMNDYATHGDFMRAVTEYVKATFKAESTEIRYINNSFDFETLNTVSQYNVYPALWDLLKINDESEISLLHAYMGEFDTVGDDSTKTTLMNTYDAARAQHQGIYAKQADFVVNWLTNNGHLDNVSKLVADNLDLAAIGEVVMKDFTESYSHYFTNERAAA